VYGFQVRIYDIEDRVRAWGEYYEEDPERSEPVMTAHLSWARSSFPPAWTHAQSMQVFDAVCHEIAENLGATLF